jgi:hypothetical protein
VPQGGRRNLLLQTEDFSNAVWSNTGNLNKTYNQIAAPDGTLTADKLIPSTTNGSHYQRLLLTSVAQTYQYSVYVKAGENTKIGLYYYNLDNTNATSKTFDVSTGMIITQIEPDNVLTSTATIEPAANGFYRCTLIVTVPAANSLFDIRLYNNAGAAAFVGDGTSGVFAWGAQLELGPTATNYQRVTTQHDVTEAGVASVSYLYFDGAGDAMATSTITPGIDKAQIFAGVRRIADTIDAIAEFSTNWNASDGSFLFWGGTSMATGTGPGFNSGARGNAAAAAAQAGISPTTFAPPVSAVLTVTHDIAGDLSSVRGNGVAGVNGTADKGTGNFLAYPLYIGRRSNGDFPLEGHLYSLITRFGPNLDAPTIASTEAYVAGKTGFYTPIITGVPTVGVS